MAARTAESMHIDAIVRICADAVMVNAAFFVSFLLRYVWLVGVDPGNLPAQDALREHVATYLRTFWLLTSICFVVFGLSGFYTRGRFYQHRFKLLTIAQAVSASYLIFSLVVFLFWHVLALPRSVILPAWLLTLTFLVGSRVLLEVWRSIVLPAEGRGSLVSRPQGRRILLIGGAGYIGSALLPRLLAGGSAVRLVDALLYGSDSIRSSLAHPNLELLKADFRHVDVIVKAMRDVDSVIHLGAIVGDPACELDQELTIEVNLMATRMLAEVAKGSGVRRFIFASTCSVYGAGNHMLDERSEVKPISLYAKSKLASERVLFDLASDDFAPVVLRFATVYGLSGRARFDLVVNLLTARALMENEITVFNGDQWRPFVHVDDAAQAAFMALEAPLALVRGQILNVGSQEQNQTIRAVAEIIQKKVPTAKLIETINEGDRRNYRVSFDKIRRTLGFECRWTLEAGIEQVVAALESGQVSDYRDAAHSNARSLDRTNGEAAAEALRTESGWVNRMLRDAAGSPNPLRAVRP